MNRNVALMLCGALMLASTVGYIDPIDALFCRISGAVLMIYGYAKGK